MEHHNISKLLNDSVVSKFLSRKWIEVNDLSGGQYSTDKNVRFKTLMLRSNLCDYSDSYLFVKETIDIGVAGNNALTQKGVLFKNNAPFR